MKPLFALTASVIALVPAFTHAESITFGIAQKNGGTNKAIQVAAKFGRIQSIDRKSGLVTFSVHSDRDSLEVLATIQKRSDVITSRVSRPELHASVVQMDNVDCLRASISEFKARNEDLDEMARADGRPSLKKEEKFKTGYYESHLYWLEQRAYPGKKIDYAAYRQAAEHVRDMESVRTSAGDGIGGASWEYIGPTNLDVPYRTYYGIRPINGRINALAVDPSSTNTLYVGSANGGLFKSLDAGVNWTALTDYWPFLTVSSLAIHPSNPQTVYVGTGDFPGGKNFTMGIMKSTDGGTTFSQQGFSQFGNSEISSIVVDPENPDIVTISTGRGSAGGGYLWRSTNGGSSWTQVLPVFNHWFRVEIGPLEPGGTRTYYAVGSGTTSLYKSTDRGASWTQMASPYSTSQTTISVAASPTTPGTVYLMNYLQIWKSTNYGASWTNTTNVFPNGSSNYFWSQFSYNWFFDCSSGLAGADVLYVGAIDVAQSPDGGATWKSIGGPTFSGTGAVTHNDQHFVTIDPVDPNKVYIGGDGGAYRYTYNPAANTGTWGYLSRNLQVSQFYKIAVHPTNPNYVMGGTQDNASPHSLGNLSSWDNVGGGDGGFCEINWLNTSVQYATSQSLNIYKTSNGWSTSTTINPSTGSEPKAFIAPIYLDVNNPNYLYAGTNYLYRRTESAGTWANRLGGQQLSATGTIRFIVTAPGDSNRIYVGSSAGEVWMSTNFGTNWTQINTGSPSLPNRTVTSIAVHPLNKNDVFVVFSGTGSGHVYRCQDTTAATRVWQDVSGSGLTGLPNTPANTILIDPVDFDNTWYVGTDLGAFMTQDGGLTWLNMTQPLGLPNTSIYDYRYAEATNFLTAGTFGRGIWRIQLPVVLHPASFTVVQGTLFGGALPDLRKSDNARLTILMDETQPNGVIEFNATLPTASLTEFQVYFETQATRSDMTQFVDLWNAQTSAWEIVDSRPTTLTDTRITKSFTSNPGRFVDSGSLTTRGRLRWIPVSDLESADGYSGSIDRFHWRYSP